MYWSKEDFGVRPVLRLSHQAIYRASPRAIVIATNQIYADHYLDAGLTLTMTIDASEAGGKPSLLHGLGQPRPHPIARRPAALVRPLDGAEPQPRRAAKDPGVDENQSRTALTPPGVRSCISTFSIVKNVDMQT